jgi:hypothetical protein
MSAKLKPCPFCGGPARLSEVGSGVFEKWYMAQACCNASDCAATSFCATGKSKRAVRLKAIAAWHRRPLPPESR